MKERDLYFGMASGIALDPKAGNAKTVVFTIFTVKIF